MLYCRFKSAIIFGTESEQQSQRPGYLTFLSFTFPKHWLFVRVESIQILLLLSGQISPINKLEMF